MKNLRPLILSAVVAIAGAQSWAQTARISTVAVTTGVVTLTERTAGNTNPPVTSANQPVYVGDNLAGLTFFNGNPGIDGTPTNASAGSPTSAALFTLTGALIPGGAATDLHAFMGYGTIVGPPTQAATYNDVAPLLAAGTTYSGLTFAAPNLYPGGPAPLKANEFYMINHAVNGTDYLAAITPFTGGGSAVTNIKPMSWQGGVAATAANTSTVNGYFALTFAEPTPTGPYFANLFYYLRTDTLNQTQFGYVIPALVSTQLDTLNLTTAAGGFGAGNYKALVFSPVAFGGYAAGQFYYLREDTGVGRTGHTILGRLDTTPGNRTISDIANLGGVYRTLTYVTDATGTAPAWGSNQLFVAGAPLAAGAQSISFAAVTPLDRSVGVPFTVSPTASSGLGLTLTVAASSTGAATIVSPVGGIGAFTITPTSPGIVTLRATQAGSVAPLVLTNFFEQSFNVAGPTTTLVIPTKALTVGVAAVSFIPVTATGGTGVLTYSILPVLANGTLAFNVTTGAITGTPSTAAGAANHTVTATDATLASSSKTFSLTVNPVLSANQAVATSTVTTNTAATAFTPVTAVGGSSPFTFTVTPLPTGLAMNSTTGQITGTPTAVTATATYTVTITDGNGATATQSFSLTVNSTPPSITSATNAAGTVGTPIVTYNIVATNSPTSYAASGLPPGLTLTGFAIDGTPTVAGVYTATLTATNGAGSGTSTLTLTVAAAGVVPSITSATSAAGTVGATFATYNIVATNTPTSYSASGLPAGLSLAGSAINGTPTTAGVYTVTLTATNGTGPGTATLTITIASPGSAPSITNSPLSAAATAGQPFGFTITASGSPLSYSASDLPTGLSVNALNGAITGTPGVAGTFLVGLSATNSNGTGSATLTLTVGPAAGPIQTVAPTITSPTTAPGTIGVPFNTFIVAATNAPTSYTATGLPAGLSINSLTGAINGTPTVSGTFVVTVTATNNVGSSSSTVTMTIAAAGTTPAITSPLTAAGTLGQPFTTYLIAATGLPTNYAATNLPPGLALNALTGAINGTPTQAGTTFVTLAATNASGTGNATLMIVIAPAAVAPIISSPSTAPGVVGTPFVTYLIIATGTPTSYTATGLPAGLTLNPLTGAINGTPTTAGTFVTTVQATNSTGTTSATVTITVAPEPVVLASRIVNFSARALSGPGDQTLLMGFVVAGDGKDLLVRGIGPGLTPHGVVNVIVDPMLTLFGPGGNVLGSNDDWGTTAAGQANSTLVAATAARVGAFALPAGSKDSALLAVFNNGAHTTSMVRPNSTTGVALTEIYDTDTTSGPRLINVSARMNVTPGEGTLIVGLYIAGNTPKTVLIRGVGPSLAPFGVTGLLADPTITVFAGATVVATNDNWGTGASTAAQLTAVSAQVGAFALVAGSRDAVLVLNLQPGAYTVQVTGVGNTSGVALLEVYDTQ